MVGQRVCQLAGATDMAVGKKWKCQLCQLAAAGHGRGGKMKRSTLPVGGPKVMPVGGPSRDPGRPPEGPRTGPRSLKGAPRVGQSAGRKVGQSKAGRKVVCQLVGGPGRGPRYIYRWCTSPVYISTILRPTRWAFPAPPGASMPPGDAQRWPLAGPAVGASTSWRAESYASWRGVGQLVGQKLCQLVGGPKISKSDWAQSAGFCTIRQAHLLCEIDKKVRARPFPIVKIYILIGIVQRSCFSANIPSTEAGGYV